MADGQSETKGSKTIREAWLSRFSGVSCLRCGKDLFVLKEERDEELKWSLSDDRIVQVICANCGMIESHAVYFLENPHSDFERFKFPND